MTSPRSKAFKRRIEIGFLTNTGQCNLLNCPVMIQLLPQMNA